MRFCLLFLFAFTAVSGQDTIAIDKVWAGHQIGFCLLTHNDQQFIAYYDSDRQMKVGQRQLSENSFTLTLLPKTPETTLGWDSHNYVTLGMDEAGFLHLSGNMHAVPLIYYRSTRPYDISSLKKVDQMIGNEELRCTYPKFMNTKQGELLFTYRDGGSGNGNQIYNIYHTKTKSWKRLLDTPLTNGEGLMNAYISLPKLGKDNWYHSAWVWRDTPDCSTNHDLSYMKSPDLQQWFTASGEKLSLPITGSEKRVIVDDAQPTEGLINGGFRFCLDNSNQPTFVYHKYDVSGNIQLYVARFDGNKWIKKQITNWDYRWEFSGNGSINSELKIDKIWPLKEGGFEIAYWHLKYGYGIITLTSDLAVMSEKYQEESPTIENFNDLLPQISKDIGTTDRPYTYELQWKSRGKNRDESTALPPPSPSQLYLVKSQKRAN